MPMINEAVFCLMEGVAEKEAIDTVMKLGMNHPMGPLALADLIGLDTCLAIMEVLHDGLGDDKYRPCPLLRKYVAPGSSGGSRGGVLQLRLGDVVTRFSRGLRPSSTAPETGPDGQR
jgi:3-hydroxybutyryl-CoA dehydrogenase